MNKRLIVLVAAAVFLAGVVGFFRFSGSATTVLWELSRSGTWLLPLVGVAALLDSVNPCAFSILLLTIAFLFSIGRLRRQILAIGGAYILGIFIVYLLIGLGLLQTLHLFDTPHFMAKLGAFLMVVLGGINIVNHFFPRFPIKLKIPHSAHHKMAVLMERGSIPTAFLLGGLVGICEFPCTGGPYLMVLGLLHDSSTYLNGLGYLVLYNLIFVLPLVVILFIAGNSAVLERVRSWQELEKGRMRLGAGIAMVLLGIAVYFL